MLHTPGKLLLLAFLLTAAALHAEDPPLRSGIGCWFWGEAEFRPNGYRAFIDLHAQHSAFGLLTTSIRHPSEVTDDQVREQISEAARYAAARGMGIVMDLDVRLARKAFYDAHPEDLQELARVVDADIPDSGTARIQAEAVTLNDHYTFKARPYDTISSRLLRVYTARWSEEGFDPATLDDVTPRCRILESSVEAVRIEFEPRPEDAGKKLIMLAAFTLFTPDAFSPNLIPFEREILQSYAGAGLAGACKDEWGFPGRFEPSSGDLWFSRPMAEAYAVRRAGRDLEHDLLLMSRRVAGRDAERAAAINHYMAMQRARHTELERAFYENVKSIFGPKAFVGTHPTWYPWPGAEEAFKNGLNWWEVPRDVAQTDETTPYSVRTALTKKIGSPYWLNMYYAPQLGDYERDIWPHLLGGGRMNFHPRWPAEWADLPRSLLGSDVLRADARIRLLDLISKAPVDCPVAVVFGHPSFLNFATGGFADAGVSLTDALWERGIYADLIPSSEIVSGHLRLEPGGRLAYGKQRYTAAIIHNTEYEHAEVGAFWRKAADLNATSLFRTAEWHRDFEGAAVEPPAGFPAKIPLLSPEQCVEAVAQSLVAAGIEPQTASEKRVLHSFEPSVVPHRSGRCRLLDGTVVFAAGEKNVSGDALKGTFQFAGVTAEIDAIGLAAFRLDASGKVEAIACGGLSSFKVADMELSLPEPVDIALWRDAQGNWEGALPEGHEITQPLSLMKVQWQRLYAPKPVQPDAAHSRDQPQ